MGRLGAPILARACLALLLAALLAEGAVCLGGGSSRGAGRASRSRPGQAVAAVPRRIAQDEQALGFQQLILSLDPNNVLPYNPTPCSLPTPAWLRCADDVIVEINLVCRPDSTSETDVRGLLTGSLPSAIWQAMDGLEKLVIRQCGIVGSIPTELAFATRLTYLDLTGNGLTGDLDLTSVRGMTYVILARNQLSGSLESLPSEGDTTLKLLSLRENLYNATSITAATLPSYLELYGNLVCDDPPPAAKGACAWSPAPFCVGACKYPEIPDPKLYAQGPGSTCTCTRNALCFRLTFANVALPNGFSGDVARTVNQTLNQALGSSLAQYSPTTSISGADYEPAANGMGSLTVNVTMIAEIGSIPDQQDQQAQFLNNAMPAFALGLSNVVPLVSRLSCPLPGWASFSADAPGTPSSPPPSPPPTPPPWASPSPQAGGGSSSGTADAPPPPSPASAPSAAVVAVAVSASVIATCIVIVLCGYYFCIFKPRASYRQAGDGPMAALDGLKIVASDGPRPPAHLERSDSFSRRLQENQVQCFTLAEMSRSTMNWSEGAVLGSGGYGKVFLGHSPLGTPWAVKRSEGRATARALLDFRNEIELISRTSHRNLVKLFGFCDEEAEQILVYEFVPNGTLRQHIRPAAGSVMPRIELSFEQRLSIAVGAAEGLRYLHNFTMPSVVHRDIKSDNILLDHDLQAKVADFGFFKRTHDTSGDAALSTRVLGTPGYVDPEYYYTCKVTTKCDVYSFGVVLWELITGQAPILEEVEEADPLDVESGEPTYIPLPKWALRRLEQGRVQEMCDPAMKDEYPLELVKEMAVVADMCTKERSRHRPEMSEVALRLLEIQRLLRESYELPTSSHDGSTDDAHFHFAGDGMNSSEIFHTTSSLPPTSTCFRGR